MARADQCKFTGGSLDGTGTIADDTSGDSCTTWVMHVQLSWVMYRSRDAYAALVMCVQLL